MTARSGHDRRLTAVVVANNDDADPGYVGDRLDQHGFDLQLARRDRCELPGALRSRHRPDLVVLLGSAWSVHAPADAAALEAECELVRRAVADEIPVLAICYGAQVLAHALGGSVSQAPEPEVGLIRVDTADPALVPSGPWVAFHADVLRAPPGAAEIARDGCGTQAYVLPRVLAVQFHPEVRPEVLAAWCRQVPELLHRSGSAGRRLVEEATARADHARDTAYELVDAFLVRCRVDIANLSPTRLNSRRAPEEPAVDETVTNEG